MILHLYKTEHKTLIQPTCMDLLQIRRTGFSPSILPSAAWKLVGVAGYFQDLGLEDREQNKIDCSEQEQGIQR